MARKMKLKSIAAIHVFETLAGLPSPAMVSDPVRRFIIIILHDGVFRNDTTYLVDSRPNHGIGPVLDCVLLSNAVLELQASSPIKTSRTCSAY